MQAGCYIWDYWSIQLAGMSWYSNSISFNILDYILLDFRWSNDD
jgi:hypothetical protein